MTVLETYQLAIQLGIQNDFRPKAAIDRLLARHRQQFERLAKDEQSEYDQERLTNPYSDTRILFVKDPKAKVKKVLAGIDMEGEELLLADKLGIDLVLAHHPEGVGLAGLDDVMHLQADILALYGVPINIAESLLHLRIEEVSRGVSPINHNRPVDMARHLGINYMCVHTPSDNMVAQFVRKTIEAKEHEYVEDVLKTLKEIPEYHNAIAQKSGPRLFSGKPGNRAGKIAFTEITGGTEGNHDMYERLAQAGVGTIIGMHMSEKHTEAARKAHINAVIAGHMSSDSIGMNLLLDELEKQGVEVVATSGLDRVKRSE